MRPVTAEDVVRLAAQQERVGIAEPPRYGGPAVGASVGIRPAAVLETAVGSSLGPPGACMTPSMVRNVCRVRPWPSPSVHCGLALDLRPRLGPEVIARSLPPSDLPRGADVSDANNPVLSGRGDARQAVAPDWWCCREPFRSPACRSVDEDNPAWPQVRASAPWIPCPRS